jgi:hypothetical protein
MTETIVVIVIVALAAGWIGRLLWRRLTGRASPCAMCEESCDVRMAEKRQCPTSGQPEKGDRPDET